MKNAKLSGWTRAGLAVVLWALLATRTRSRASQDEQVLITRNAVGRRGGKLVISQRAEPKTLNPAAALDGSSRELIGLMHADLIHINRLSQKTEPALASSWTVSPDGRQYTLQLRRGLRFSDGVPFDADDVLFTFQVYLDERIHSSQRDLLIISGKPILVSEIDAYTVRFDLQQPYAAAERLFDSVAILPRHLLKAAYDEGKLSEAWTLTTASTAIAGLGPFELKGYVPGQYITLERNQYYWKKDTSGNRLPYLDEILSVFTGNADAEAMRFQLGEIDVVSRLSAANFSVLEKHKQAGQFRLYDAGPSLEYSFLFFNLNDVSSRVDLTALARRQAWFRENAFRKAVSAAIDRAAIARLVYRGRASPLSTQVTPGNKLWLNRSIPQPGCSIPQARQILREAGFSWLNGRLRDNRGDPIVFSILFNAGNPQHTQIATLMQADLEQTGMEVRVVPLEFHALLDRVFKTYEYDAAIMSLLSGDADPNSEMNVWTSSGSAHVWNLTGKGAQIPWQQEIDRLMQQQMVTVDYEKRKNMYDRVQELVWDNLPMICLVSPDVLVGAADRIGNFHPANLTSYTLWNIEQLYSVR